MANATIIERLYRDFGSAHVRSAQESAPKYTQFRTAAARTAG